MIEAYTRFYTGMSPEEAEVDLKATMAQDRPLQERGVPSPTTEAKQQAYSNVFHDRPLTLRIPAPPTASPTTPAPGATATPPVAAPKPPAPPQGRTGTATATPPQQTPQAQPPAMLNPYRRYYETFDEKALQQEEDRLRRSDPLAMNPLTAHRLSALNQVRSARQHAATSRQGQDASQLPPKATPQEAINHYRAQYQHFSTADLLTEQRRLMNSDPFSLSAQTSLRLSVINMLITQRQNAATPQPVAPGLTPEGTE
jgi:hypothetical protein